MLWNNIHTVFEIVISLFNMVYENCCNETMIFFYNLVRIRQFFNRQSLLLLTTLMTNYFYIILSVSFVAHPVSTWLLMLWFYCSHFIHDGNGKFYTTCWILQSHRMVHLSTSLWLDNIFSIHNVLVLLAHLFLFYFLSYLVSLLLFFFTPPPNL